MNHAFLHFYAFHFLSFTSYNKKKAEQVFTRSTFLHYYLNLIS